MVIPTTELQQRMAKLHNEKTLQIYLCTTGSKRCWEIRGLGHDVRKLEEGVRKEPLRDFTQYLNPNGWAAVANRLKG